VDRMATAATSFNALATDGDVDRQGKDWGPRGSSIFVAGKFIRPATGIDPRDRLERRGRLWRETNVRRQARFRSAARPP